MWRVFALSLGALANSVICEMGAKVRARSTSSLCFFSVRVHRDALGWRARIWVTYPPLALDQEGMPGICHENHMDLRRRPTYISDPQKLSRARLCSLSVYGEESPVVGRCIHKKAGQRVAGSQR